MSQGWLAIFAALTLCALPFCQCQVYGFYDYDSNDAGQLAFQKTTVFNDTVRQGSPDVFPIAWQLIVDNQTEPLRLFVSSNATNDGHLLVVMREATGVLSWALPFSVEDGIGEFRNSSRTVCPRVTAGSDIQQVFVDISTAVNVTIAYSLELSPIKNFTLTSNVNHTITLNPPAPQYFRYDFLPGEKFVQVSIISPDLQCAMVSVQTSQCPIYDLGRDIAYSGARQTFTTQAGVLVDRETFGESFTVVLFGLSSDERCASGNTVREGGQTKGMYYEKGVVIRVVPTPSSYTAPILFALGVFLSAYLATFILLSVRWFKEGDHRVTLTEYILATGQPAERQVLATGAGPNYGSLAKEENGSAENPGGNELKNVQQQAGGAHAAGVGNSVEEGNDVAQASHKCLPCSCFHRFRCRTETKTSVADLSTADAEELDNRLHVYPWLVFVVSVFYGVPVIQLVYEYQRVLITTGDQDLCYYNFNCARRLGSVSAFNNVYSNIGYVLLGILFLAITRRRQLVFLRMAKRDPALVTEKGLPQSFGLYYALGLSLAMEGVMSGCFHVCPSNVNFQFDTSFMYIITCISLLRLYQNRHPDIVAGAHKALTFLAVVISLVVYGVINPNLVFWGICFVAYVLGNLLLNTHLYFFNFRDAWRSYKKLPTVGFKVWIQDISHPRRFFLLLLSTILNLGWAIYGISDHGSNVPSFVLNVLISNLLVYLAYYVIMKMCHGERLRLLTLSCSGCMAILVVFAMIFYVRALRDTQASPAVARERNKDCVLLDFYDEHDIWHFLSAGALFFYALILLTIDDDRVQVLRSEIPAF